MSDYYVRMVALPRTVEGVTVPNDDGTYSVYINSEIPAERQQAALAHEIEHIKYDHLYSCKPLSVVEREADGYIIDIFNIDGMIPEFKSLEALKHWTQKIMEGCL